MAIALTASTDWLLFEEDERGPSDELKAENGFRGLGRPDSQAPSQAHGKAHAKPRRYKEHRESGTRRRLREI